jgi:hypothetical protein
MGAIGGSIESVQIDGRNFAVAADAESNRKLGGFENEKQANGDGTTRTVKTRVPWKLDGISLSIDDARGDLEFLQQRQNGNVDFACIITYASGISYQGTGTITGEVQASSQNATAPITLEGSGVLTRQ